MKKIIVGISGASGSIYGIDLLEKLSKATNVETHLVMSNWAKENIKLETDYSVAEVENLADFVYDNVRGNQVKCLNGCGHCIQKKSGIVICHCINM